MIFISINVRAYQNSYSTEAYQAYLAYPRAKSEESNPIRLKTPQ